MKLLKSDKEYFKKCGYLDTDIQQIEKAISVMKYTEYGINVEKKVSRKYVLENMDRETWLSGIGRSSFHWTASRELDNGNTIMFDASKLFK